MLLLGFGNKARHGKDTAAEAIREHYMNRKIYYADQKVPRIGIFKFATALYEEVNEHFKHNPNWWWSSRIVSGIRVPDWVQPEPNPEISPLAPYGKHPKLLQWWGTEFRRNHSGTNYWVDKLFASIPTNLDIAMVSDTRFPNEADGVKQRGGYTVNVQRLREDGTQYYSSDRPVDHPSEIALDGYDWDFYLKIPHGHAALTGEFAITLAEYLRGLQK